MTPVSSQEFRSALDPLLAPLAAQGAGRLALAVSGGSDSMALLRLAHEAYPGRIAALMVDHGLREASAREAAKVGAWCNALGIAHCILHWQGEKPVTGIQRRAREARYRLLAGAAGRLGANGLAAPLIVAHTLNDQAETFLLRLAHGSDLGGLGGMRASTEIPSVPPVPVLRPMLGFERIRLRATLEACGQPWIDDPSNQDERFERVRLRRVLPRLEAAGPSRDGLARASRLMARIDASLLGATLAACPYNIDLCGAVSFGAKAFAGLPEPAAVRYLSHLIRVAGGEPYPPARASLSALAVKLRARGIRAATLGGCHLRHSKGNWIIEREARAAARMPAVVLADRRIALWDNRFWVLAPPDLGTVRVEARGHLPALAPAEKCPDCDFVIAEDVAGFRRVRDRPAALFVGEARMLGGLAGLWRLVMAGTPAAEYDAATVS